MIAAVAISAAALSLLAARREVPGLAPALVAALPAMVQILTAAIGAGLVHAGWPRRIGRGLYCGRCAYYQEQAGPITAACPECGHPWRWAGWSRLGRPVRRWWSLAAGAGLLIFVGAVMLARTAAPWFVLQFVPTRVLLEEVRLLPDWTLIEEWREIKRRKLGAPVLDALATPLMTKRARGPLSADGESVLFEALTRPTASATLAAQYFEPMLLAPLRVPDQIDESTPLVARCNASFRGRDLGPAAAPVLLILSEMSLVGSSNPPAHWEWNVPFADTVQGRFMEHTFDPPPPGTARVVHRFWIVAGGPTLTPIVPAVPVAWLATGPSLPQGLVVVGKCEFESTVEVVPTLKSGEKKGR